MPPVVRVAIAIVEDGGRFLAGRRDAEAVLAGCAEFPGGKLLAGESPQQAAVRECREETGLDVAIVGSYPPTTFDYPHGTIELHFFACRPIAAGSAVRSPFAWVDRAQLAALDFPPANAEVLAWLLRGQAPLAALPG